MATGVLMPSCPSYRGNSRISKPDEREPSGFPAGASHKNGRGFAQKGPRVGGVSDADVAQPPMSLNPGTGPAADSEFTVKDPLSPNLLGKADGGPEKGAATSDSQPIEAMSIESHTIRPTHHPASSHVDERRPAGDASDIIAGSPGPQGTRPTRPGPSETKQHSRRTPPPFCNLHSSHCNLQFPLFCSAPQGLNTIARGKSKREQQRSPSGSEEARPMAVVTESSRSRPG